MAWLNARTPVNVKSSAITPCHPDGPKLIIPIPALCAPPSDATANAA
ncbi:MAG: hypothetical protein MZV64_70615 [Ignavibacteriales bacterium]|nr:hypothetical protein [Ignavibacteriales bacterium]